MKNVTITLDEKVAAWLRVRAAERGMSVSRYIGELLQERMRELRAYNDAMRSFLSHPPFDFRLLGGRRPTRQELHDRARYRATAPPLVVGESDRCRSSAAELRDVAHRGPRGRYRVRQRRRSQSVHSRSLRFPCGLRSHPSRDSSASTARPTEALDRLAAPQRSMPLAAIDRASSRGRPHFSRRSATSGPSAGA
jgi:hypothetical protein